MVDICEHANEALGSVKGGEYLNGVIISFSGRALVCSVEVCSL